MGAARVQWRCTVYCYVVGDSAWVLPGSGSGLGGDDAFPFGLLISVAIGVVLGILLGSLMLSAVLYVRRYVKPPAQQIPSG